MNKKSNWVLYICLGIIVLIFGCAMEISLLGVKNMNAAKAGWGFVILGGLYLIYDKGIKSKPSKYALEMELETEKALQSPLLQDERVLNFYQGTLNAWAGGKLSALSQNFQEKVKDVTLGDLMKEFPPYKGSAIRVLFEDLQPLEGEFLVGTGNLQNTHIDNSSWFVLTNFRLIQKDGTDNQFKEVILSEVNTYKSTGDSSFTLVFKMKSGEEVTFVKLPVHPSDKFLDFILSQKILTQV